MQAENSLQPESLEPRGALCVECLCDVSADSQVLDRTGAALCRTCAAEFYAACAGCGGLVPKDEALARPEAGGALQCFECFRRPSGGDGSEALSDEEVEALVAEYVALHEELKRLESRASEVKEQLKRAATARPRVSNAVVLRAGEAGVRCSYASKASYDAEKLAAAEALLGAEGFGTLFERKVSFAPVKGRLEEFLSADDEATAAARDLVRAAESRAETTTLTVVAQRKKKSS
jgi:hypothetical protein